MNAILNAYKQGQPVKIEASRNMEERTLSFYLTTDDGQTLAVTAEADERIPDHWDYETPYDCKAVWALNAHYTDGQEVYFSEDDDSAFDKLACDYLNDCRGEIDEYYPLPKDTDKWLAKYIKS